MSAFFLVGPLLFGLGASWLQGCQADNYHVERGLKVSRMILVTDIAGLSLVELLVVRT